jgi:STE24 endopeptidase
LSRLAARRAVIALGVAILAGAWLLAAIRLWHTSVPGSLNLPSLDPHAFFTQAQLDRASSFEAFIRIVAVLALVAQVVALGVYALVGGRFVRESAAGRIGTGMLLGMLGFGFVWFSQLPFGLVELWWERRYDVSHLDYVSWLISDFLSVGGEFLFISLALLIVMALTGVWRRLWWLAAAPALIAVFALFAVVQPYLIPDLHPLHDPKLAADARQLADDEGIPGTAVRVQGTHNLGGGPNAEATGIGPSKRVILWDTLVKRFNEPQIRVVMAHEFGHLSRDHILKQLAWMLLLGIPIAFVVALATRRRGGLYEPEAVPIAIFAVVAMLFVLTPLNTAFTRRLESEADWVALQTTRDPGAAKQLFRRFTIIARVQPDPPGWANFLFGDHPSVMRRIEMAEAWRALNPANARSTPAAGG